MTSDDVSQGLSYAIQLQARGEFEEARKLLLQVLIHEPDNPQANYRCACVLDALGNEREAISLYERALDNGLDGSDREAAIIGLGSSYRALGEYPKAIEVLRCGASEHPDNRALQVFLAMSLYNTGRHCEAMQLLLRNLAETSEDGDISDYGEAIAFYAEHLDEVWS